MKLIYFTPKRFQFVSADNAYVLRLAESFRKILDKNFIFVFISKPKGILNDYNIINLNFKLFGDSKYFSFYLTYVYFFIWTPFFLISRKIKDKDNVFWLGDIKLLTILILWKKILRYDYKICSDWHMYHDTKLSRFAARNSNRLITTSEKLKNLIITKTKIDSLKIKAVYGGTDLFDYEMVDKIEARKKLNLPLDKKLVGYIGLFKTMGLEKGIDTMMKALLFLDKSVVMVFVGARAGEVEAYKKMAVSFKVEDRCIIVEKKNLNEVVVYQQAMDILAIPYPDKPHFRDYGFPMKVYDYMAAKRPIIYSRLDLVEEVIADYGYPFIPDDPDDFANNLKKIFSDYDEAEIKAGKAFAAVKEFSWDKKAEKIINFIK